MVRRLLLVLPLLAACDDPCPRGSMLDSQGKLTVTEAEHPTGWGFSECEQCHDLFVLHRLGCTPDVNLEEVREEVDREGVDSCARCHGDNGVVP